MDETLQRLIRDRTAGEALVRWGQRHNDAEAEAIGLAYLGEDLGRWIRICDLSRVLNEKALARLDAALADWRDESRTINTLQFEVDNVSAMCRIARQLRASGPYQSDQGAQVLAVSTHVENLMVLELGDCHLTTDGIDALAASPYFRRLTTLKLNASRLGAEGIAALSRASYLEQLTTLELYEANLGPEGARVLARIPTLKNLIQLQLSANVIGDEGARAVAESPRFDKSVLEN